MTKRILVFAYGAINYLIFLGTFLYLAAFLANVFVPKAIDSPAEGSLGLAMLVNTILVGVFAVQHTLMARPTFKKVWTKFVPRPIERATYVLFTNAALVLLFWQWRPMGGIVWDVQSTVGSAALYGLCAIGWLTVLVTTFLINHFDLFGLRQVWLYLLGKPYTDLGFTTPGPYKLVRHPLYVGWTIAFWATPTMTVAHLVFAIGMTTYMLVAIQFEERNLVEFYGEKYANYRKTVPMMIPFTSSKKSEQSTPGAVTSA